MDPHFKLIETVPVYLTQSNTSTSSEYFLARYPSQLKQNITTLSNSTNVKLKPKQKLLQLKVPLFNHHDQVSVSNCDETRLEYFKNQANQNLQGILQTDNKNQQLFAGQVLECSNSQKESISLHLTPLNGVIFFRPKQTILDILDQEKSQDQKRLKNDDFDSTDDEFEDKPKPKKSMLISSRFDKTKSSMSNPDKSNRRAWVKKLNKLEKEDFIESVAVTGINSVLSSDIRDNYMTCKSQQRDVIVTGQSQEEYFNFDENLPNNEPKMQNVAILSENFTTWTKENLFLKKLAVPNVFFSIKDVVQLERISKKTFSERDVDEFCYRLTIDNSILTIQSTKIIDELIQRKELDNVYVCNSLVLLRDMSILVILIKNEISEKFELKKFQAAFINSYTYYRQVYLQKNSKLDIPISVKPEKINKYIRDVFRMLQLTRVGMGESSVWTLPREFKFFDESMANLSTIENLKKSWPKFCGAFLKEEEQ